MCFLINGGRRYVDSRVYYAKTKGLSAEANNYEQVINFFQSNTLAKDFKVHAMTFIQLFIYLYCFLGTPMWVLFHLGPIKNEKGEVMLFLVTLKDITEYKDPIVGTGKTKLHSLYVKF